MNTPGLVLQIKTVRGPTAELELLDVVGVSGVGLHQDTGWGVGLLYWGEGRGLSGRGLGPVGRVNLREGRGEGRGVTWGGT